MSVCFDKEFLNILTPEEIIYVYLYTEGSLTDTSEFIQSSAYTKLFDYYSYEMPYGVAKCRDGEPDLWILDRLRERYLVNSKEHLK